MPAVTVETKNGIVQGTSLISCEGIEYYAFKGIPYAKPPLGDLRFKDPEPAENWIGIKDVTKFKDFCLQESIHLRAILGTEDCLYLNVYVKSMQDITTLKPVMVLIHGGAFTFGSGDDNQCGPDYLMRKDIVLVTFNYRVGIFGFLNLEDEIAPGNQGFKDQIMVLRWIQENIKNFGGDPNNVTIFGESAGAYSVHCLYYSPLAKGLFHKAIAQSLTAYNTWAKIINPRKQAIAVCIYLRNFSVLDNKSILEFLKSTPSNLLIGAQVRLTKSLEKFQYRAPFGPGVDAKAANPVMPIPLEEAALKGFHLPYILGYNDRESIYNLIDYGTFKELTAEAYVKMNRNFKEMLHPAVKERMKLYNLTPEDIRRIYYPNGQITLEGRDNFVDMMSDWYYIEGIHKDAEIQAQKNPGNTYFYKFCFTAEDSSTKKLLKNPIKGACHFDEMEYIACCKSRKINQATLGHKLMQQMVEMWTNFATYGSPTPKTSELIPVEWLPMKSDTKNIRYLNIDTELRMETMPYFKEHIAKMANKQ